MCQIDKKCLQLNYELNPKQKLKCNEYLTHFIYRREFEIFNLQFKKNKLEQFLSRDLAATYTTGTLKLKIKKVIGIMV